MRAAKSAERIRVTMIGSLPPQRGVSQYTHDLVCEIAARDDVKLDIVAFRSLYPKRFYPGGDPDDQNARPVAVPGARTRRPLRWWNPTGWLLAALTLRGDVVHAQWWSFPLAPVYIAMLAVARLRGKRVVVTVHNAEPHEKGVLRRVANRAVVPFAQHVIVHTQQGAEALAKAGTPAQRISVVPIGVGPARVATDDERAAVRARLGIDAAAPVVLFHGNIRPYKGLSDILAAFRSVVDAMPDARLFVAGQPWGPAEDVRREIASRGVEQAVEAQLEFVPSEVLDDLFIAADAVVYPYTHFDAQSAAACDALRYGKAIIVTSVGGLPELVRNKLAVVPPRRPDALANALLAVLRDDAFRASLEQDAKAIASELTWTQVASETVDVYRRVLYAQRATANGSTQQLDEVSRAAKGATTWH